MKRTWMILGAAAALMVAGCQKSENNANQPAASTPSATPDANQAAGGTQPGNASTSAPANGNNAPAAAAGAAGAAAAGAAAAPAPVQPPPPPPPFAVVEGTSLPIILSTKLNSRTNQPGDTFQGSLASSVLINGEVAIPKGSTVRGEVVDAKKQGTFKGQADLAIHLTSITIRGKDYPITSSTYAATVKGKGKRTAVVTGGGAALGALIGGLAGGGKGAAIGAGVGGGGGLAASGATGGENVTLPAESRVTFKLSNAISVDHPVPPATPATAPAQ
jgi:uncharacterized lipoprotein YbaY